MKICFYLYSSTLPRYFVYDFKTLILLGLLLLLLSNVANRPLVNIKSQLDQSFKSIKSIIMKKCKKNSQYISKNDQWHDSFLISQHKKKIVIVLCTCSCRHERGTSHNSKMNNRYGNLPMHIHKRIFTLTNVSPYIKLFMQSAVILA